MSIKIRRNSYRLQSYTLHGREMSHQAYKLEHLNKEINFCIFMNTIGYDNVLGLRCISAFVDKHKWFIKPVSVLITNFIIKINTSALAR